MAVWPPPSVLAALASLRGADEPGVRWMGPEHWHVTLRFLGTVDVAPAVEALSQLLGCARALAVVATTPVRLGREVIALPVDGLVPLAAAVDAAFAGLGRRPDHRPFRGHLTLARGTGSAGWPAFGWRSLWSGRSGRSASSAATSDGAAPATRTSRSSSWAPS